MTRLVLVIALVAACAGPTARPTPTILTLAQAAQAYDVAATAANEAMEAASKGMSGTPEQIQAYCRTRVDIERAFLASLDDIAFDLELALLVATLRDADQRFVAEIQACLDAEGRDILKSIKPSLIDASRATHRAATTLRARLGLPMDGAIH